MAEQGGTEPKRAVRINRQVDVRLLAVDSTQALGSATRTIDLSEHGLLIEVPKRLDAVCGQQVRVSLRWASREFQAIAEVVRIESPYWKDGRTSVMGLHLDATLPADLLSVPAVG